MNQIASPSILRPDSVTAFARWFDNSLLVDETGAPRVFYHATRATFGSFEPQPGRDHGFHFGTETQARARAYPGDRLLQVYLSAHKLRRMRDKGYWTRNQISRARRSGADGIIYLNRYEGMTAERVRVLAASGDLSRLDQVTDAEFRRLVPEAEDSVILFDPCRIKAINNPGTWDPRDPRIMDASLEAPACLTTAR